MEREKLKSQLWNKMDDLLKEAKENGINFTFSAHPNGFYDDEDCVFLHTYDDNFDFDVE